MLGWLPETLDQVYVHPLDWVSYQPSKQGAHTMSTVHDPMSKTPAEWRKLAQDSRRTSAESFERSDTDGFLSQWANDQMAIRYDRLATLAEEGGTAELARLADADGNVIEGARYVETRYGWSWVYDTDEGAVWFRESNHSNPEVARKRDLAKGHQIVYPRVPVLMGSDGHLFEKREVSA